MANTIKIGNLDISAFKVGSDDCKVYLGDTLLYPTEPPVFQDKFKATYSNGNVISSSCDSTSAITEGEINLTNLVSVEIGDYCVTSIDWYAFEGCTSLTSCTIGNNVASIGDQAFSFCSGLTSVTIPDSVTSIGMAAFQYCRGLTSVTISSGVTSIGMGAFANCTNLTSITVNATNPPQLGSYAFAGSTCPIYVLDIDAYKSASGWSTYASRIQAIPNS